MQLENLARKEYNCDADEKVKEELLIANIPVLRLGVMNNEVKTRYIGLLNGFVFVRAWRYWVVKGNMPLKFAKQIYENYKDLNIRVNGDAGNSNPNKNSCREVQDELVISMYHIDTQLGLCKFAEMIKQNNIYTELSN